MRATLGVLTVTCLIATAPPAYGQADPAEGTGEASSPQEVPVGEGAAEVPEPDEGAEDDGHDNRGDDADGVPWSPMLSSLLARVDIHGFVSQGFILTTENNYLADSEQGSFEFTEVGLNFTTQPIENLRLGMQLFARDLGPIGDYNVKFDWFYADYRVTDWFGLRVGRTKLPFGLYNEINDIDVARAPILLPQSVYPTSSRDFLLAQNGVELYGLLPMGDAGALEYRAYGGTVFVDVPVSPGSPLPISEIRWPYVLGGRLLWETPLPGLRLGGSIQALELDADLLLTDYTITTDPETGAEDVVAAFRTITIEVPAILWVASLEYMAEDLLLAAEYSRWHTRIRSSDATIFPENRTTSERLYAMGAYRVTERFQPAIYYSLLVPDVDNREGRASRQHDAALTLRYDINAYWLLKAEAHYMNGTADLESSLNGDAALDQLTEQWGLFLLKTTAYF